MAQAADRPSDVVSMEALIRHQLVLLGEDPSREGLRDTPERVKESLEFLTRGYRMTLEDVFGGATFTETYKDMIVVKDIEMYSLCEHHLLPFYGRVHIGYIPKGQLVGLSKMPRLVELYSRRLQVQERMTRQIAECLQKYLEPVGVGVVIEADHLCMKMRGVEKQNSRVFTSCVLGIFQADPKTPAASRTLRRRSGSWRRRPGPSAIGWARSSFSCPRPRPSMKVGSNGSSPYSRLNGASPSNSVTAPGTRRRSRVCSNAWAHRSSTATGRRSRVCWDVAPSSTCGCGATPTRRSGEPPGCGGLPGTLRVAATSTPTSSTNR